MMHKPLFLCSVLIFSASFSLIASNSILVQSTTSTQNSGLFNYIVPIYQAKTGIEVKVVAVGTGQALKNAANGDADVVMVHAKSAEEIFIKNGYGIARRPLMYNQFFVVGPSHDPAGIQSASSAAEAFMKIASSESKWISRGDMSGTHKKELQLWKSIAINPKASWYLEVGSGMGRTLGMTIELDGYTLVDSATWISYKNKGSCKVLYQEDQALSNQYSLILVNDEIHPHVNTKGAKNFMEWLLSSDGQSTIAKFKLNGQQLFYPNADKF